MGPDGWLSSARAEGNWIVSLSTWEVEAIGQPAVGAVRRRAPVYSITSSERSRIDRGHRKAKCPAARISTDKCPFWTGHGTGASRADYANHALCPVRWIIVVRPPACHR
jgi:hypothetical protein